MKKIITFDKNVEFPSMIGEITSISLEDKLEFIDNSNINGKLKVAGTYKRTEASRLEEEFNFTLPADIILTEKLDLETAKVEIDNFYYEQINDNTISCHISILVEGVEIVDFEEPKLEEVSKKIDEIQGSEELRECDGDNTYEEPEADQQEDNEVEEAEVYEEEYNHDEQENNAGESEDDNQEYMEEAIEEANEEFDNMGSLFTSLKDSEETFSTYSVYIIREEETLNQILDKYSVSKEELENYNDLNDIKIGSKLIIPIKNEQD